jgi:hypothetical protein
MGLVAGVLQACRRIKDGLSTAGLVALPSAYNLAWQAKQQHPAEPGAAAVR